MNATINSYEQSAAVVRWAIRWVAFSGQTVTLSAVKAVPKCAGLSDQFVMDQIAAYWS
jgi:hypothetical protein